VRGPERPGLLDGDHVVAHDLQVDRRIQLTDALHQVVGERVVVVDEQDLHGKNRDSHPISPDES
jgi:hypothetical protein